MRKAGLEEAQAGIRIAGRTINNLIYADDNAFLAESEGELKCLLMKVKLLSRVRLLAAPWTAAYQAPPPMGLSRQEYWSGLPCPPPGDLPDPGTEPASLTAPALAGRFFTSSKEEALHGLSTS